VTSGRADIAPEKNLGSDHVVTGLQDLESISHFYRGVTQRRAADRWIAALVRSPIRSLARTLLLSGTI
jgi:hypothetical protein